jgi:heme/copper-type cytochrome/quinol oxidase subunit 2
MKGVVVVGEAAPDAPTPTPTPTAEPAGGEGGAAGGGGGDGGGGGGASAQTEQNVDLLFRALSGALAGAFALIVAVLGYAYGRYRSPERPTSDAAAPGGGTEAAATGAGVTAAIEAAPARLAQELGHDEFDPTGTATLLIVYFVILALMWVFMYFVEFLGRGPTIIG